MKFANEVGHYEIAFEDLGAIAGQLTLRTRLI
jgi:hypothetical protein